MPEGPELASSRDYINQLFKGQSIIEARCENSGRYRNVKPQGFDSFERTINSRNYKLEKVCTKGKFMWWVISCDDEKTQYMCCTYGMSGQWSINKTKHTSFSVTFSNQKSLYFNDPRRFGTIKFCNDYGDIEKKLHLLGPCVLSAEISESTFIQRLRKKSNKRLAEVLLDQSVISGVGNYLRAEIMYKSSVDPWKLISELSDVELKFLYKNTIEITNLSYKSQGATISTYRNPNDASGHAQFQFMIYGKLQDPNGNIVIRKKDKNGRTVHWCPDKQQK